MLKQQRVPRSTRKSCKSQKKTIAKKRPTKKTTIVHNNTKASMASGRKSQQQQPQSPPSMMGEKPRTVKTIKTPKNIDDVEALLADENIMRRLKPEQQKFLTDASQDFMAIHYANTLITMKLASPIWQSFQLGLIIQGLAPPPAAPEDYLQPEMFVLDTLVRHGILRIIDQSENPIDPVATFTNEELYKDLPSDFINNPHVQRFQDALDGFYHHLQFILPHSHAYQAKVEQGIEYVPNIINPFMIPMIKKLEQENNNNNNNTSPADEPENTQYFTEHYTKFFNNVKHVTLDTELDEFTEAHNIFALVDQIFSLTGGYELTKLIYQDVYHMEPKKYATLVDEIDNIRTINMTEQAFEHNFDITTLTTQKTVKQKKMTDAIMALTSPRMTVGLLSVKQRDDVSAAWASITKDPIVLEKVADAKEYEETNKTTQTAEQITQHIETQLLTSEEHNDFKQLVVSSILQHDAIDEFLSSPTPTHFYSAPLDLLSQASPDVHDVIQDYVKKRQMYIYQGKENDIEKLNAEYEAFGNEMGEMVEDEDNNTNNNNNNTKQQVR